MILYILSITLSAFALFLVQPLIGKALLPWFGGTSAVWSAVLLFFQTTLTGGYLYASWLVDPKGERRSRVHLGLLILALVLLGALALRGSPPILPGDAWRLIDSSFPIRSLLLILTLLVGLPGFLLAANSTLVQTWFSREFPRRSPYWLYALSNGGSLLALFAYPIFFERSFPLPTQAWIWSGLFLAFAALALLVLARESRRLIPVPQDFPEIDPPPSDPSKGFDSWMWVGLSLTGSICLLSTTSRLTQEVAPIPLLWVLPLAVYLLTFILSFAGEKGYSRPFYLILLVITSAGVLYDLQEGRIHFYFQLAIYLAFLFAACMVAHGELYRLRPGAGGLARFYTLVSVGGAAGGILVNLVAPLIFNGYWEFYLGWFLVFALLTVQLFRERQGELRKIRNLPLPATLGTLTLVVGIFSIYWIATDTRAGLYQERNFYGVSKVTYNEYREAYNYINGATLHGFQFGAEGDRDTPTAYFWRGSGIAILIRNLPVREQGLRVGVMGLGIGTLAAHGQEGDQFRFYEIDPGVIGLAQGKGGYFSFLADSPAEISLVEGDARLSLERELAEEGSQGFDLLVMDAFSSDSVPVHLLTLEAFELYLGHLDPGGVIAVNISNNYLDLKPVIWRAAKELDLYPILIDAPVQSYHPIGVRSRWAFLVQDPEVLDAPEIHANKESLDAFHPEIQLWTDQYSNLFEILW